MHARRRDLGRRSRRRAVARTALGIELRDATLQAEGDLDFRGTLDLPKHVRVWFRSVRLECTLDTDASDEQLDALLRLTERYCVVYQTLAHSPSLEISRQVPRDGSAGDVEH